MTSPSFSQLYIAIAEAVKQMPVLHKLAISFALQSLDPRLEVQHEFLFATGDELWTKQSSAELKVNWSLLPYDGVSADVVAAWIAVGVAKSASIDILVSQDPFYWESVTLLE